MALSKEDYVALGRNHAQNQGPGKLEAPTPYALSSTSWQAQAYWQGFDSVIATGRLNKSDPDHQNLRGQSAAKIEMKMAAGGERMVIKLERMAENTAGWPKAAAEHARRLAVDINAERHVKRRERLCRALRRMQKRYQAQL